MQADRIARQAGGVIRAMQEQEWRNIGAGKIDGLGGRQIFDLAENINRNGAVEIGRAHV